MRAAGRVYVKVTQVRPGTSVRRRILGWLPFLALATIFLLDQARLVLRFAQYHTEVDQTLLWYAAKEFIHGRFHEPNFFGQRYNTVFESVPGALLHVLGMPYGLSMPLSSTIFATSIWLILAAAAYFAGRRKVALLALAAPLVIRVHYLVLFDAPRGVLAGEFLGAIAVAYAIWLLKDGVMKLAAVVALGGVACLWDYATAFFIAPLFLYLLCQEWPQLWAKPKRALLIGTTAALLPVAWLLLVKEWYATHPYDLTAPSISLTPKLSILLHNIHHFSPFVEFYAPAVAPIPEVAVVLFCVFLISFAFIAWRSKSYALLLSTLSLVVLMCLALSLPRASGLTSGLYLGYSRLLLSLPIAVWVLVLLASFDRNLSHIAKGHWYISHGIAKAMFWLIAGFAVISFGVTQVRFRDSMAQILAWDGYFMRDPRALISSCKAIDQVYDSTHAQLFATNDINRAYGCAAQFGSLNTIEPIYDRRGWIIQESYTEPSERILISGDSCDDIALPDKATCTVEGVDTLLIQTPPTPAAQTLAAVGLPVKFSSVPDH
jgi:hypothetical protein